MSRHGAPPPSVAAPVGSASVPLSNTVSLATQPLPSQGDAHLRSTTPRHVATMPAAVVYGSAAQRQGSVSPAPMSRHGSTPLISAPHLIVQASPPFTLPTGLSSGGLSVAVAAPSGGLSVAVTAPSLPGSCRVAAAPQTARTPSAPQRCYSTGSLHQATRPPGVESVAPPQVARFYSGATNPPGVESVAPQVSVATTSDLLSARGTPGRPLSAVPWQATRSHPPKIIRQASSPTPTMSARSLTRIYSAEVFGTSADVQANRSVQSCAAVDKSIKEELSRGDSPKGSGTPGRGFGALRGPSAVGKLHHDLAVAEDRRKTAAFTRVPDDSLMSHSAVREGSINGRSRLGDSGGTGEDHSGEVDEAGHWEVPYSRRAKSPPKRGATSPGRSLLLHRTAQSTDGKATSTNRTESRRRRSDDLYQDHEMRQRKWLARYEEKVQKEEAEVQHRVRATCSPRSFKGENFKTWYSSNMAKKQEVENSRVERQRSEARLKSFEELSECTFAPQIPSPKNGRTQSSVSSNAKSSRSRRDAGKDSTTDAALQAKADELISSQVSKSAELRQLEDKELSLKQSKKKQNDAQLEKLLEDGRRKLRLFEETAEGREYLATRAQSYMELNRGMSEEAAMKEARSDLSRASEAKLHAQAISIQQKREHSDEQQLQILRLKVAWELIRLQRRYQAILDKGTMPRSMLQGFDETLVEKITQEAWYIKARSDAKGVAAS
eukprot:TRINITY_DN14290_c0_g2_i1.p1 TRINITY_DN14290_c0_g2~~TRINITY_DN14290_c0_g2_i1.p1  ORF type:complete len:785 (+),score=134.42 TRINITY_DN14290_c0_g2_i1:198-2357(+)